MDSIIKTRGLVVKENVVNDTQKVITILTKEYGKLSVWVKSARTARNKYITAALFSYADFVLYCGKTSYTINEINQIENFYNLTNDLDKLAYGTYILEFAEKITMEDMPCDTTLFLILKSLQALTYSKIPPELIARVFDLKFLQLQGYMPETHHCLYCSSLPTDIIYFGKEGLVCENCINSESNLIKVTASLLYTMQFIFHSPIDKLFTFNLSTELLFTFKKVTKMLTDEYLPVPLKSYAFIKEIEALKK